jgi:hypothetical protein
VELPSEVFDLPLRRVELLDAEPVQALAALPQLDGLLEARLAALELPGPPRRSARSRAGLPGSRLLDPRGEPAVGELDVDHRADRDGRCRADDASLRAHDRVAAAQRRARVDGGQATAEAVDAGAAALDHERGRGEQAPPPLGECGALPLEQERRRPDERRTPERYRCRLFPGVATALRSRSGSM